jgi:energy-coupling factor transporter ATP-binding protein EcfA2
MKNVNYVVKDGELTLTVKLDQKHGLSGSGKSEIIASTDGIVDVDGTSFKLNLSLFAPLPKAAK